MIKLSFDKFNFVTDGIISRGSIIATIKYYLNGKYKTVISKKFETKTTLHKDDTPDLNKAFKYIRAKLERDAYAWAGKEAKKEVFRMNKQYEIFDNFIEKALHIVSHDNKYLKTF